MGPFLQELTSFPHVRVWLYMTGKIDESTNLTIGQYQVIFFELDFGSLLERNKVDEFKIDQ